MCFESLLNQINRRDSLFDVSQGFVVSLWQESEGCSFSYLLLFKILKWDM